MIRRWTQLWTPQLESPYLSAWVLRLEVHGLHRRGKISGSGETDTPALQWAES